MKFAIQFYDILKVKHRTWRKDVIEFRYWLTQMMRKMIQNGILGFDTETARKH